LETFKAESDDITNSQSCALLAQKMSRGMGLVESNHRAGQITTKQSKTKQNRTEQNKSSEAKKYRYQLRENNKG